MKPIVISFNKKTSEKDIDDLRLLLEDIKKRYNFTWHLDTYAKDGEDVKSTISAPENCRKIVSDEEGSFRCGVTHNNEIKLCDECKKVRQDTINKYCAKCGLLKSFHSHKNIFIRQEGHKSITSTCKKFIPRDVQDTQYEHCKNCGHHKVSHKSGGCCVQLDYPRDSDICKCETFLQDTQDALCTCGHTSKGHLWEGSEIKKCYNCNCNKYQEDRNHAPGGKDE